MLSKSFIASIFLLASISSANAHAGVTPALGVQGQLTRNDVQRPSTSSPCGNVNIAQTLDSSTPVQADQNGDFSPNVTNFNGGADGSRSIKEVQVDTSGTGKNFVPAKMVVNGDANPTNDATQQLTVQLPSGTKCAGGTGKNLCLASFTTTAGFGNCVVVSQGAGASKAPASRSMSGQSNVIRNGAAKGVIRSTDSRAADDNQADKSKDGKKKTGKGKKKDNKKGKGDKKVVTPSTDSRAANDDQKNQNAGNVNKSKDAKKKDKKKDDKKGNKKNDNKKGGKKNGKQASNGAPDTPAAADGNNRKRSWSSRQMGNFA